MDTEIKLLRKSSQLKVKKILSKYDFEDSPYIEFLDEKTIRFDGDFKLPELKRLVKAMEVLDK